MVRFTNPTCDGLNKIKNKTALFKYPKRSPIEERTVVFNASF